jgi:pimeloyl-ACP methyl ester carboxylesterase
MRSILQPAHAAVSAPTQMIWLPGAYFSARSFVDEGFAATVAKSGKPVDLRFVDLEMTHLQDKGPLEELRSEIILPARAAGVTTWLAGISLGGLFALDYASAYPGEIDGLCLLAPYLGNRMTIDEIAAGRLAQPDTEHRIWHYIKTQIDAAPVYLGYGRQDRFSRAHDLMAAALPAKSVDVIDGGHEWRTWCKLWERFLDSYFS